MNKTIIISICLILVILLTASVIFFVFILPKPILVSPKVLVPSSTPIQTSSATPTLTQTSIANVILSPNSQIVNLSLNQQTNFNVTIAQKGYYNLQFPCTITVISNTGSSTELGPYSSYGTYAFDFGWSGFMPRFTQLPSQGQTISFYALVKDSNGESITSNTVTVQYK